MITETNDINVFSGKDKTPLWRLRLRYIWQILTHKQIILLTIKGDNVKWHYNNLKTNQMGDLFIALGENYNEAQQGIDIAQEIANDIKKRK